MRLLPENLYSRQFRVPDMGHTASSALSLFILVLYEYYINFSIRRHIYSTVRVRVRDRETGAFVQCNQKVISSLSINKQTGASSQPADHKCFCIESCFAFLACSVRQSRFRGLPQDAAVPSRCRRRDSPEKMKILKIAVSYDFSRINMT